MTHESITSNIVSLWNKMGQVSESVHKVSECVQELAALAALIIFGHTRCCSGTAVATAIAPGWPNLCA